MGRLKRHNVLALNDFETLGYDLLSQESLPMTL